MSAADLRTLSDVLGIEPRKLEAAVAVVRLAVREEVRQEVRAETDLILGRMGDRLLTKKEAAARAGVSTRTLDRRRAEGKVRVAAWVGRGEVQQPRFHPGEIDRAAGAGDL